MSMVMLTDEELKLISNLVYSRFGINLNEQKRSLIIERLQKTLRLGNFPNFKAYYGYVVADKTGKALLHLVDKLSTNHTYFFRENEHYNFLTSQILPNIIKTKQNKAHKSLRIWSAGCSTGEEAYTIAMVTKEFLGFDIKNWDIGILATDISTSVLQKAGEGLYGDNQLTYTPQQYKKRYFKRHDENSWALSQEIRDMVFFRRLNLINTTYPFKGLFDVIFCRNVMIYFDDTTRQGLVERFSEFTEKDGHLFIGHSESLSRNNPFYKYIKPAIYQKVQQ